jgi:E3 ubiquitin-protein ligase KEG
MWCRNVCGFYGVVKSGEDDLCVVMEKCFGSVKEQMEGNGGRLSLDQILRSCSLIFFFKVKSNVFLV